MTNSIMMAEPGTLALVPILLFALILLAVLVVGGGIAIYFSMKRFRQSKPVIPPTPPPQPIPIPSQPVPTTPPPLPQAEPQAAAHPSPPLPSQTLVVPKCPQCHVPLASNAPQGLCPECLAKAVFPSEPAADPTRTPPSTADLAAQFPQLEIIELLGIGGMGMVYKARQPKLDRIVALKILPVSSAKDPSFAERFAREARALARLNHPGIVTIFDFGQTDHYYYFIMEFVDGMNLRQLLRAKKLSPEDALKLVTQICAALQFAHDEGIVHRDIKPENILINQKGYAKIADFGLAKLLGNTPETNLTASQMVMGTFNYMAPEQREKPLTVDHRADIYSLGVVFYEMLTGELPIGRFQPPSQKVHVDVRLDEVVLKSLEKEPDRRYQHASEVKTDVESFTSMHKTPPSATPSVPAKLAWSVILTELLPVLAILGLVGFGIYFTREAWLVFVLLISELHKHRKTDPRIREWARIIWIVGVVAICGLAVWIAHSIWPLVGLIFLFDWGGYEKEDDDPYRQGSKKTVSPESPSLDDVKRLAAAGEKHLARKLYRKLYKVSSFEARIAVDKMAAAPAPPSPAVQPSAGATAFNPPPPAAPPPSPAIAPASQAVTGAARIQSKTENAPASDFGKNAVMFVFLLAVIFIFERFVFGKTGHSEWLDIALQIALPAVFLLGLIWIIKNQKGGLRSRDLPPALRRRMALQIAGLGLALLIGISALITLLPIRITDHREYWFVPNSGAFRKLAFAGEFTRYDPVIGNSYDATPASWDVSLKIFTNDAPPAVMTVTLPGMRAGYELPNVHGGLVTHVLDRDVLTEWLQNSVQLNVNNAKVQLETQQIMQLLKTYETHAPHTADEFDTRALLDLQDFSPGGFTSSTSFTPTFRFSAVLLAVYFLGSIWIVRRTFRNFKKTSG